MPKTHRPMIGLTPVLRYNVSLPPEAAKALRKLGDGIRVALQIAWHRAK